MASSTSKIFADDATVHNCKVVTSVSDCHIATAGGFVSYILLDCCLAGVHD